MKDDVVITNIAPNDIRGHWRSDSVEICLDPVGGAEHTMGCYKLGIFPFDTTGVEHGNGRGLLLVDGAAGGEVLLRGRGGQGRRMCRADLALALWRMTLRLRSTSAWCYGVGFLRVLSKEGERT